MSSILLLTPTKGDLLHTLLTGQLQGIGGAC